MTGFFVKSMRVGDKSLQPLLCSGVWSRTPAVNGKATDDDVDGSNGVSIIGDAAHVTANAVSAFCDAGDAARGHDGGRTHVLAAETPGACKSAPNRIAGPSGA